MKELKKKGLNFPNLLKIVGLFIGVFINLDIAFMLILNIFSVGDFKTNFANVSVLSEELNTNTQVHSIWKFDYESTKQSKKIEKTQVNNNKMFSFSDTDFFLTRYFDIFDFESSYTYIYNRICL